MLYLAVEYNENKLNKINIIGLVICLSGIVFHCILKFYALQSTKLNIYDWINNIFFVFLEEKPTNIDPIASERLLLHRLESVDEWSLDSDLNTRRSNVNDWPNKHINWFFPFVVKWLSYTSILSQKKKRYKTKTNRFFV